MGGSGGKNGDTARSIGFQWTLEGTETLFVKSKVLIDARSAGVGYPLSGGWMDIHDLDGLRVLASHLRQLGYHGIYLIHPSHVSVVNEVFTPTQEEIAYWRGLIQAMEARRQEGSAVVTYNGDRVVIGSMSPMKKRPGPCYKWSKCGGVRCLIRRKFTFTHKFSTVVECVHAPSRVL